MKNKELDFIFNWFAQKKWKPLPFQIETWGHFLEGKSGLVSVPTGAGKTYATYMPALSKLHMQEKKAGIKILYITPLRALAKDMELALKQPIEDLALPYRVEKRTGDTSYTQKKKQQKKPPEILLTTPESLAILLSYADASEAFAGLQTIIIDEWHELLGSKRGVLLELNIAKLKGWNKEVQIWGMSATLGNLQGAAQVCVGMDRKPALITASMSREVIIETILPKSLEGLPWAGQLGLRMLPYVLGKLSPEHSTLIFTNTRSQAERWHQAIVEAKPEWEKIIALHHSSVDKKIRESIETDIKTGLLRFVICTSSLDLGIDLPYVEKVIQIGSPKSVARLIQRAGRSSHKPLTPCHISLVPTHALEVAEIKGYRQAITDHLIEERIPLKKSFDVLLQHLMSCAIGEGFEKEKIFQELKTTSAFSDLSINELGECLTFLISGGNALGAYPEYKKLVFRDNRYLVEDSTLIRRHRMNIGTITSDPQVVIKWPKGKSIGVVEEAFLVNMKPGDTFLFGGKRLELIQYRDMTAYVRLSKGGSHHAAVWQGGRLPFSAPLGRLLREVLSQTDSIHPESLFLQEISRLQNSISHLPKESELLIEVLRSKEGWHLFIYPFEGKAIHQGLAMLIAHRLSKASPHTFTLSTNDYGFEILSRKAFNEKDLVAELFSEKNAEREIEELVNMKEAGKSYFRDIARIAGLVFQGYPGKQKSHRNIQISSSLLFDVFEKYDPQNLLLQQAKRETLEKQFEKGRLKEVLSRLSHSEIVLKPLRRFSPFALPLFIERVSGRLTTETLAERVESIKNSWSKSS